jgi:Ala-tRNA(Pro) deacylase
MLLSDHYGQRRAMADVTTFLDEAGLDFEVLEHAHTERAADEAAALGVSSTEVAKTLVLTAPEGNVRAVLPASERIDLRKVGDLVGASSKKVHLATEDDLVRDYADFELGAVPPFGGKRDPVILDLRLAERDSVVLEAGSHERSVRMKAADLVRLTDAQVADISREGPLEG